VQQYNGGAQKEGPENGAATPAVTVEQALADIAYSGLKIRGTVLAISVVQS